MIGTKLGHYVLVRQIGEGGIGAVYLAKHRQLGTKKAVKLLLPKYSQNESLIWRLQNEAIAVARLRHRNIVSVDDFGQLPDGQWYIMMPFLEGMSLDRLLARHERLPVHQSLHILAQVCAALEAAHAAGIIHRDLKPANVFLTATAEDPWKVTLLDFGLAKLTGNERSEHATGKGKQLGTPEFMAPEVVEDSACADQRSDIFALGVMAYLMVTGEYPFGGRQAALVYHRQISAPPPRPEGVPVRWADEILRALLRSPGERPQSAADFARSLAAATPFEPPKLPSGEAILIQVARELVTPSHSSLRASAGVDRIDCEPIRSPLGPLGPLWPPVLTPATVLLSLHDESATPTFPWLIQPSAGSSAVVLPHSTLADERSLWSVMLVALRESSRLLLLGAVAIAIAVLAATILLSVSS